MWDLVDSLLNLARAVLQYKPHLRFVKSQSEIIFLLCCLGEDLGRDNVSFVGIGSDGAGSGELFKAVEGSVPHPNRIALPQLRFADFRQRLYCQFKLLGKSGNFWSATVIYATK